MKIYKTVTTFIIALLPSSLYATELYPRQNDKGKWGYVDESGNKVIDYKYTEAFPFENNMAKVKKGTTWGYLAPSGKEVIKLQYSEMLPWENGRCKVAVGGNLKDGILTGAKWGYISTDGTVLLKPEYDKIGDFENGIAYIQKSGKYGYINNNLDIILKCEYSGVGRYNPQGLCWIAKWGAVKNNTLQGAKYGIADNTGKIIVAPKYKHIGTFVNPIPESNPVLCKLMNSEAGQKRYKESMKSSQKGMGSKMYLAGFTNSTNDVLDEMKQRSRSAALAFQAEMTEGLNEQETQLYIESPTWGMLGYEFIEEKPFSELNMTNSPYIAVSNANFVSDNSSWLITIKLSDKIGILDSNGSEILKPGTYGVAFMPSEGYIPVAKKKGNGFEVNYVAPNGKPLLSKWVTATTVTPFVNGNAVIAGSNSQYIIDNTGQKISDNYSLILPGNNDRHIVKGQRGYGIIDTRGNSILSPTYNVILPDKDGLYCAQEDAGEKFGYIGPDGKFVIEPVFDKARSFVNGSATASKDGCWGVIDTGNKTLVEFQWEDAMPVSPYNTEVCWVRKNGLWRALNLTTFKNAFAGEFHGVTNFDGKGFAVINNSEGLYGCLNSIGTIIIPMRLSSSDMVEKCLDYMSKNGKSILNDIEVHRFNLKNNPKSNTFRLSHKIDNSMWEF